MDNPNTRRPAILAALILVLACISANAQEYGIVNDYEGILVPLDVDIDNFKCLSYCVEITYEQQTNSCNPVVAPPLERCPLPWVDPRHPTPLPPGAEMDWCVPEEGEFIGFHHSRRNERIREIVHHMPNCETDRSREVIQVLPSEDDDFECTGAGDFPGPRRNQIIRFVPCP